MMCVINYISAAMRYKEANKTVIMLRDDPNSNAGVPEMVLAQREFIQKEKDYFAEECIKFFLKAWILCLIGFIGSILYHLTTKG